MDNNKIREFEIMAPVGSRESLVAAIQAGADSVYFGIGPSTTCATSPPLVVSMA